MSIPETSPAGAGEQSAVLPVAAVITRVREWVDLHARHWPDFAGAYLWGGITALPPDAPFPLYRDVDVVVVMTTAVHETTQEVFYQGLMLEVILQDLAAHRDVEAVLADPSRGPNLATTQILADPTGILVPLHQAVAANYRRRRWIQARCDAEKATAEQQLVAMRQLAPSHTSEERFWLLWQLLYALSGLLAVAQLERPTTRRTLALLGELLDAHGRSDLHEAALTVWGSAHLSRSEVQTLLNQSVVAFDRSVEVYHTPTPYGFTIRPHLRPYLAEATQELIDAGQHREAMFWIMTLATESYLVLHNDAPDPEKPVFAAQLQTMFAALGLTSAETWAARVDAAERLAQELYRLADALVALHPE
jgi:hypothetical protein